LKETYKHTLNGRIRYLNIDMITVLIQKNQNKQLESISTKDLTLWHRFKRDEIKTSEEEKLKIKKSDTYLNAVQMKISFLEVF